MLKSNIFKKKSRLSLEANPTIQLNRTRRGTRNPSCLIRPVIAAAALSLCAALAVNSPSSASPKIINIERTKLHKNFFEIPVAVVPKFGYNFESIEKGVADKKQKVALEGYMLHISFPELLDGIANNAGSKGGIEVKSQYSFIWNGSRAELMKIFAAGKNGTIGKWVLITDVGSKKSWMICGSYDAADMRSAQLVLDMVKSACWEKGSQEPSLYQYGAVSTSGTPFRFAGSRQGALVYTKDGKIPTESEDQALFVISSPIDEFLAPEKRAEYAIAEVNKIERDAAIEIISQDEADIGGIPALSITAKTKDDNPAFIFQTALFHEERVTMLVGIARSDAEANFAYFKKLADSFYESSSFGTAAASGERKQKISKKSA